MQRKPSTTFMYHSVIDKDYDKYKNEYKLTRSDSFYVDEQGIHLKDNKLGAGGFGSVFQFLNPEDKKKTAVKMIRRQSSKDEKNFTELVEREALLTKEVYPETQFFCDGTLARIAMPYFEGKKRSYKDNITLNEFLLIAKELRRLHEKHHIVHGDFNSRNFFIEPGKVHIFDFGLSQKEGMEHTCPGSDFAPELRNKVKADYSQDVYQLGSILGHQVKCSSSILQKNISLIAREMNFITPESRPTLPEVCARIKKLIALKPLFKALELQDEKSIQSMLEKEKSIELVLRFAVHGNCNEKQLQLLLKYLPGFSKIDLQKEEKTLKQTNKKYFIEWLILMVSENFDKPLAIIRHCKSYLEIAKEFFSSNESDIIFKKLYAVNKPNIFGSLVAFFKLDISKLVIPEDFLEKFIRNYFDVINDNHRNYYDEESYLFYELGNYNIDFMLPFVDKLKPDVLKNYLSKFPKDEISNLSMIAAKKGYLNVIRALSDAKVDLNIQDEDGNTPAHFAVKGGFVEIIKVLSDAKADFTILNSKGESPLDGYNSEIQEAQAILLSLKDYLKTCSWGKGSSQLLAQQMERIKVAEEAKGNWKEALSDVMSMAKEKYSLSSIFFKEKEDIEIQKYRNWFTSVDILEEQLKKISATTHDKTKELKSIYCMFKSDYPLSKLQELKLGHLKVMIKGIISTADTLEELQKEAEKHTSTDTNKRGFMKVILSNGKSVAEISEEDVERVYPFIKDYELDDSSIKGFANPRFNPNKGKDADKAIVKGRSSNIG